MKGKGGSQRTSWTSEQYEEYLRRTRAHPADPSGSIAVAQEVSTLMTMREKELQQSIYQWLIFHEIYFEWDRMDKRTSGKRGRADFRACVNGRWLSIECKVGNAQLTVEQEREAARLRKSGGTFVVARSREDAIQAVSALQNL